MPDILPCFQFSIVRGSSHSTWRRMPSAGRCSVRREWSTSTAWSLNPSSIGTSSPLSKRPEVSSLWSTGTHFTNDLWIQRGSWLQYLSFMWWDHRTGDFIIWLTNTGDFWHFFVKSLTFYVLHFSQRTKTYIYILSSSSTMTWHR